MWEKNIFSQVGQKVKMLASKLYDLGCPQTHMVGKEKWLPQVVLSPHTCPMAHTHALNKWVEKRLE